MWPGQAARSRVAAQREGRGNWYGAPRWGAQHKYGTAWLGGSFTVFVDGFGELVTEAKLRGAFARDGKVQDVEIQPRRRGDSRFKFGFVHYALMQKRGVQSGYSMGYASKGISPSP